MRAEHMVRRVLASCRGQIHAKRLAAAGSVVGGIVRAGRLSLTRVGRAIPSRTSAKHSIKRVDRLLSNGSFQAERWMHFAAISRYVLGEVHQPVIAVDWTKAAGDFYALYAATPIGGRAQALYLEVHPERRLEHWRVHRQFLRSLRDVLPRECRPIIVTDAGFHGGFFREIERLGWDYVGRVRGRTTMRADHRRKQTNVRRLYRRATSEAQDLGSFHLYRKVEPLPTRLVLVRKARSARHPWRRKLSADHISTLMAGKDPWLLATSIRDRSPSEVARLYGTRMQIEETFRDAKSHRFGWSLRHVRCSSDQRLTALLLLCALASLVVSLVGMAIEQQGLHRRFQANTVKKRVLSFFTLGMAALHRPLPPSLSQFHAALRYLRASVLSYSLAI